MCVQLLLRPLSLTNVSCWHPPMLHGLLRLALSPTPLTARADTVSGEACTDVVQMPPGETFSSSITWSMSAVTATQPPGWFGGHVGGGGDGTGGDGGLGGRGGGRDGPLHGAWQTYARSLVKQLLSFQPLIVSVP